MSLAYDFEPSLTGATFGSGGGEPYALALLRSTSNKLFLRDATSGDPSNHVMMDVSRWNADADDADLTLLSGVKGPMLDIGCGPGRMVRAAAALGLDALGIDVSQTAVHVARKLGINVVEGSIFDLVPGEGTWQTALLVDGNIGIGGDPAGLLARCRALLAPGGEIVIEVHDDPDRDYRYTGTIVDQHGVESASFPWAEVGLGAIRDLAGDLDLEVRQSWAIDGRTFCRLATTRR